MSLDGGYIGSIDHAIANLSIGRQQGHQQGYQEGWDAAIAQQSGYIRQLEHEVNRLGQQLAVKTQEHAGLLWEDNRKSSFMTSERLTLQDLASTDTALAKQVRDLFVKNYTEQLSKDIEVGALKVPLEHDAEFAKNCPNARKFIVSMLHGTAMQPEESFAL